MTRTKPWLGCFALATGLLALPAAAHHSFAAQYDADQPVTLTGTVTKIEWMNPHMLFYIDVKDETSGEVVSWTLEMGSPNTLTRLGWTRDSVKAGEVVTVAGSRARDGSPLANAQSVTLTSTGKKLFAGSSQNAER